MKALDLRKKTEGELTKLLGELEVQLREFRFGMSGGRTKNVRISRSVRADIARIKLIMTERSH